MRRSTAPHCIQARAGYALPAVLTMLSILTLVFIAAIAGLDSLHSETRAALDTAEFERAEASAEAHVAFLATTQPLAEDRLRVGGPRAATTNATAPAGLGQQSLGGIPLQLDGRPYGWRVPGGRLYAVSMQDGAGLMNLDFSRPDTLLRLFQKVGASQQVAGALSDQLLDYIDKDSDRRPLGAEAGEYASAGRIGPANAPLARLEDVFAVLDWRRGVDAARWRRMAPLVSADPDSSAFNVNTAPMPVLEIVLNMTDSQAQQVIGRRAQSAVTSLTQLGLPAGDSSNSYTFPNGRFRLTFTDPARQISYTSMLTLTPNDPQRPWRISSRDVAKTTPDALAVLKASHAVPLPDPFNPASNP